jgi:5-methylcytosine-specific restriction endonuclease McrA
VLSDHPCECGCGEFTFFAPRTSMEKGWVKGEPKRFAHGHNRRKPRATPSEKRCGGCGETKAAAEFYAEASRVDGLSSTCRACRKLKASERYKADPGAAYAYSVRWRAEHPERNRAMQDKWDKAHPENRSARSYRRRQRIAGAVVEKIDPRAIYERDGGKCHICGKRVAKKDISIDHLIPVSHGGDHVALNVRLAHLRCNIKRGPGRSPTQLLLL